MSKDLKVSGQPKIYGYRWIVLIAFMLLNMVVQLQWVAHAGIARPATVFFVAQGTIFNDFYKVDSLAMIYMIVFLFSCVPASYVIDKFGIRAGIGFGSALAGISALTKGVFAASFPMVFIGQIGLAIAQPFIINAYTALVVKWFPLKERGTAVGLASLSQYLGIIVGVALTPALVSSTGEGLYPVMLAYGLITAAVCLVAVFIIKENPPTPPSNDSLEKLDFVAGIKNMLTKKDMLLVIFMFLIGLGIFNAVSSMTDALNGYLAVQDSDGLIAAIMIIGGIIGAVVIPMLSDAMKKRKVFLVICIIGMAVGTAGITFSKYINSFSYEWNLTSSPEESNATTADLFINPTHGIQRVEVDADGLYTFNLTVVEKDSVVETKTLYLVSSEEEPTSFSINKEDGSGSLTLFPIPAAETDYKDGKSYFVWSPTNYVEDGKDGSINRFSCPVYLENASVDNDQTRTIYILALIAAFILGFFVMSAGPVGFQYAAEVTFPTPEASSQGVLLLAGQITGILFTVLMSIKSNIYIPQVMLAFSALAGIGVLSVFFLKESPMIITEQDKAEGRIPTVK